MAVLMMLALLKSCRFAVEKLRELSARMLAETRQVELVVFKPVLFVALT